MAALPAEQREILLLRELEDMSYAELAVTLASTKAPSSPAWPARAPPPFCITVTTPESIAMSDLQPPIAPHVTDDELSAYLDAELAAPARQQLAAHLSVCPHCADRLSAFYELAADLGRLPSVAPDVDLTGVILGRLPPVVSPSRPTLWAGWRALLPVGDRCHRLRRARACPWRRLVWHGGGALGAAMQALTHCRQAVSALVWIAATPDTPNPHGSDPMKPQLLRIALIFSLLINAGVLGAAAYRGLMVDSFPGLPDYLGLSPAQTQQWHATEQDFLAQLAAGTQAIETHRVRLIEAIFAEVPDPARIDAERLAIATLQDVQQQRVIEQLLKERALLDAAQRDRLAALLLAQPAGPSGSSACIATDGNIWR